MDIRRPGSPDHKDFVKPSDEDALEMVFDVVETMHSDNLVGQVSNDAVPRYRGALSFEIVANASDVETVAA